VGASDLSGFLAEQIAFFEESKTAGELAKTPLTERYCSNLWSNFIMARVHPSPQAN